MADQRGKPFVITSHYEAQMYENNSATDGYKALKLYLLKVNTKCKALFQLQKMYLALKSLLFPLAGRQRV